MTAALYNKETLGVMRGYSRDGYGVHAVAAHLGWTPQSTRTIAKRHDIALTEEDPKTAKPIMAEEAAQPAVPFSEEQNTPPAPRGKRIRRRGLEHPRASYITIALSDAALDELEKLAGDHQLTRATLGGVILDRALRAGQASDIASEAKAERETAS